MATGPTATLIEFTKPVRAAARASLVRLGKAVTPWVIDCSHRPAPPEAPASLHVLLSSKSWKIGLLAIHSFEFFTRRRWQLFIHEDGSIDDSTKAELLSRLPGAQWVSRSEADARVAEMLKPFPACRRRREQNTYSLKFFDSLAFAPGSHYVVLDGDVLFYAEPPEIISWVEKQAPECWFNFEEKEAYGAPRAQMEEALGFPLWGNVNSGLSLVYKEAMSLAISERFLTICEEKGWDQHVIEQALFAVNASAFNQGGSLPSKYEISKRIFHHPDAVCRHYVGPFKEDLLFVEGPISLLWRMTLSSR